MSKTYFTLIVCFLVLLETLTIDGAQKISVKKFKPARKGRATPARKIASKVVASSLQDEPLINAFNSYYIGDVSVGTPSQNFTVIFDTGSADLWIPSVSCPLYENVREGRKEISVPVCYNLDRFNESKSSTYKNSKKGFSITYGDGTSASGHLATDTVTLAGFQIKNQVFGDVTNQNAFNGSQPETPDGILGMGFIGIASSGAQPPVMNLFAEYPSETGQFSFWLNRVEGSVVGGEFTIGGSDSSKYTGSFVNVTVVQPLQYWTFNFPSIAGISYSSPHRGRGSQGTQTFQGIVDTGTTLILGPVVPIYQIHEMINAASTLSYDETEQMYYIAGSNPNLSSLPQINITVTTTSGATKNLTLFGNDYIFQMPNANNVLTWYCGFASTGNFDNQWIFGDPFIGSFYTILDTKNLVLSFARAISQS